MSTTWLRRFRTRSRGHNFLQDEGFLGGHRGPVPGQLVYQRLRLLHTGPQGHPGRLALGPPVPVGLIRTTRENQRGRQRPGAIFVYGGDDVLLEPVQRPGLHVQPLRGLI
eukprot:scaffold127061_cov31-Prasinocladus_malaysianus.AAC.1